MRKIWWLIVVLSFPKVPIAANITSYSLITNPSDTAVTFLYDSTQNLGHRDRVITIGALRALFTTGSWVPTTRTVNLKALSSDISLTAVDVGAVAPTRTVNGYTLDANITLNKSDIGLSNVDNVQQIPISYLDVDSNMTANSNVRVPSQAAVKTYVDNNTATPSWGSITGTLSFQTDLNTALGSKVPTSRTIQGYPLTSNVTLTKSDISLGSVDNVQQMPLSYLDTDPNLAANSNTKVPSQAAVVSFVAAQGAGGGTWGTIIGTLSNQTDLQTALDAKLPTSNLPSSSTNGQFCLFSGTTGKVLSAATGTGFAYSTSGVFSTTTNGSTLTTLSASNLSSGTVAAARGGAGTVNGILKANGSGSVSAATSSDINTLYGYTPLNPSGSGASLTGITATQVGALATTAFSGTTKITVGTSTPSSPASGDLWIDTTGL